MSVRLSTDTALQLRTIEAGDFVWKVAANELTKALGRRPSKLEVNAYKQQIIAQNDLKPPYIVRPGQKLELPQLPTQPGADEAAAPSKWAPPANRDRRAREGAATVQPRAVSGGSAAADTKSVDELTAFASQKSLAPRAAAIAGLVKDIEADPTKRDAPAFVESVASKLVAQFRGLSPQAAKALETDPNVQKLYDVPGVVPFLQAQQIAAAAKAGNPFAEEQLAPFRQGLATLPPQMQAKVLERAGLTAKHGETTAVGGSAGVAAPRTGAAHRAPAAPALHPAGADSAPAAAASPPPPAAALPMSAPGKPATSPEAATASPQVAQPKKAELVVAGTPLTLEQGLEVMRKANEKAKNGTVGTKSASLLTGAVGFFQGKDNALVTLMKSRDQAVNLVETTVTERMKKGYLTPEEREIVSVMVGNAIGAIEKTGKIRDDLSGIVRNAATTVGVTAAGIALAPVTGGASLAASAAILARIGHRPKC